MTTPANQPRDKRLSPVNPTQTSSALYKTIMALRSAHAPIEGETDHKLETLPTTAAAYERANSFTEPAEP